MCLFADSLTAGLFQARVLALPPVSWLFILSRQLLQRYRSVGQLSARKQSSTYSKNIALNHRNHFHTLLSKCSKICLPRHISLLQIFKARNCSVLRDIRLLMCVCGCECVWESYAKVTWLHSLCLCLSIWVSLSLANSVASSLCHDTQQGWLSLRQ